MSSLFSARRWLLIAILFLRAPWVFAEDPAPTSAPPPQKNPVWLAHLIRANKEDGLITDLGIADTELPVTMVFHDKKFRPLIQIPLIYNRPGWKLYAQGKPPIRTDDQPGVQLVYAYLNGRVNQVDLTAVGPNQEREFERLYVAAPEAQEFKVISPWDAIRLSAGSSLLRYSQSGFTDYRAWTGLLGLQVHSDEAAGHLGFLADGTMTVLTASSSVDYAPQIGHGMLDAIYFFSWSENSSWRVQALAGVSYLTMLSNGAPFGFQDLISMDVGVRGRYVSSLHSDYVYELHVSPLNDGSFDQIGVTLSLGKSYLMKNSHLAELGLRYSDFQYTTNDAIKVGVQSISFLFTYGL